MCVRFHLPQFVSPSSKLHPSKSKIQTRSPHTSRKRHQLGGQDGTDNIRILHLSQGKRDSLLHATVDVRCCQKAPISRPCRTHEPTEQATCPNPAASFSGLVCTPFSLPKAAGMRQGMFYLTTSPVRYGWIHHASTNTIRRKDPIRWASCDVSTPPVSRLWYT